MAHCFSGLKLDTAQVKMATFPLPNLRVRLAELGNELFEGKGFFILRGLDPQPFSIEEYTIISLGVSSYIREHRAAQNAAREMISKKPLSSTLPVSNTIKDTSLMLPGLVFPLVRDRQVIRTKHRLRIPSTCNLRLTTD